MAKDLKNKNDMRVCLIMYLLTVEPNLCSAMNKALVTLDKTQLSVFGPLARALGVILANACDTKKDGFDKGQDYHDPSTDLLHPLGYFCESFLLFRGVIFDEDGVN